MAALRQRQFDASWAAIDARIQVRYDLVLPGGRAIVSCFSMCQLGADVRLQTVLRDSNRTTLQAVSGFVRDAPAKEPFKIPTALIVTGPNIASQDLLFSQLAENLGEAVQGRFVCLRSAEAPNLKATLRKIIRDVTRSAAADDVESAEVAVGKDVSISERDATTAHAVAVSRRG